MFDDPDPDDSRARQIQQILICKTWLAMEGLDVKALHEHIGRP